MSVPVRELTKRELELKLLRLTGPMFVGFAMVALTHVVDAYVIGRLGTHELAAFGICLPLILLLSGLVVGLANGLATNVALLRGQGEVERAHLLVGQGVLMSFGFGALVFLFGGVLQAIVLPRLATDADQLRNAAAYMTAMRWAIGILMVPMAGTFALRALGSTTPSAQVMTFAAVSNVALAPALVFGLGPFPPLGMVGAGWGTALANALGALLCLFLVRAYLRALSLRGFAGHVRAALKVGLPNAAAQAVAPISGAVLVHLAGKFGVTCVAAMSLVSRIEYFIIMLPLAVGSAEQPLVGQLWGAGSVERIQELLVTVRRAVAAYALLVGVVVSLAAGPLVRLFSDDPAVHAIMRQGFWFSPVTYLVNCQTVVIASALVAIGRTTPGLFIQIASSLAVLPVAASLLSARFSEAGLFAGQALTFAAASLVYHLVARRERLIAQRSAPAIASPATAPADEPP